MQIEFRRADLARLRTPLCCVPLFEGESLTAGPLAALDRACGGLLKALAKSGDWTGKLGAQTLLYNPKASGPRRILLLGAGAPAQVDLERVRQTASRAVKRSGDLQQKEIALLFPTQTAFDARSLAQALAEGCVLGDYRYDAYVTGRENRNGPVQSVTLVTPTATGAIEGRAGAERGRTLADVVCKVRDMVNAPANELTPTRMAELAVESARAYGYKSEILEKRDMQKLGMGGLLAVAQGSDQPPRFIVLQYDGGGSGAPFVVVGKGLTFDAGGLCLKPAQKMDEMKGDMAGGAAALGILEAVARLGLPGRVVSIVPATENLLGGSAYRPGDILRMMNGKTVFVDNTDAEGRIILADALTYAQRFKPRGIVDFATLTGAALVALGQTATAVLGTDRDLVDGLMRAGERSFERLWELPLWEEFEDLIKSPIADIKNSGGKYGGTITAAAFLRHFVGSTPWAHLDIAGTAYLDKAEGYRPQAATGVGVRLLVEYLQSLAGSATAPPAPAPRKARRARKTRRR